MVDKLEAIRIVTRCTSREQFIAMFSRYCAPTSCFIPSGDTRAIGTATAFSIRLADGAMVLRGEGVVLEAFAHADHKFKRPGILLGIHKLDDACNELFEQLNRPRSEAVPIPTKTQLQMLLAATPSPVAELETPTIEMAPLALPEEPRVPSSPFVLPANPMAEMDDQSVAAFVECNLVAEDFLGEVKPPVLPASDVPVPVEVAHDKTEPTPSRDAIATILGVAPLKLQVFAAPELVPTEGIDRMDAPRFSMISHRPMTSPEPLLGVEIASPDVVAITYAPPVRKAPVPAATPVSMRAVERPRQRLRISAIGIVPITQVRRRVMPALRRWWLPATVATTLAAVTAVWIV